MISCFKKVITMKSLNRWQPCKASRRCPQCNCNRRRSRKQHHSRREALVRMWFLAVLGAQPILALTIPGHSWEDWATHQPKGRLLSPISWYCPTFTTSNNWQAKWLLDWVTKTTMMPYQTSNNSPHRLVQTVADFSQNLTWATTKSQESVAFMPRSSQASSGLPTSSETQCWAMATAAAQTAATKQKMRLLQLPWGVLLQTNKLSESSTDETTRP